MKIPLGTKIKLLGMPDDPDPIPYGTTGIVTGVAELSWCNQTQLQVEWENGRHLMLCVPPDRFEVIPG